jgi:outer membrane protein TolC
MVGGQHPIVGFARWRVQEAYAQLDQAKAAWLPSIQTGFNYRRRDGNYQAVDGSIVDVNLNSFNYGLGGGAVAAGSPTRPGVVAQFHLADAIFLPKSAEKTAWARGHAATAVVNQSLLSAALAYLELLEAYQDSQIIQQSLERTQQIAQLTQDFADVGEGLQSDADRMNTEVALVQSRLLGARERQQVAATRLAQTLSLPMTSKLIPQDSLTVPLQLVEDRAAEGSLVATGLTNRPELKESQALVAAACEVYKRERYAPFVPSVLMGFSTTSFGGGLGANTENFGGRYDIDALMMWELRNLGLGEHAAKRMRNAQIQQATFAKLRMMDQVAQEVCQANAQLLIRGQQIAVAQSAIQSARDGLRRNQDRIQGGEGLPIEVLQSLQALEAVERNLMRAITDYNRAGLQLQWAQGWPVTANGLINDSLGH